MDEYDHRYYPGKFGYRTLEEYEYDRDHNLAYFQYQKDHYRGFVQADKDEATRRRKIEDKKLRRQWRWSLLPGLIPTVWYLWYLMTVRFGPTMPKITLWQQIFITPYLVLFWFACTTSFFLLSDVFMSRHPPEDMGSRLQFWLIGSFIIEMFFEVGPYGWFEGSLIGSLRIGLPVLLVWGIINLFAGKRVYKSNVE
jgi:hypothetical protein